MIYHINIDVRVEARSETAAVAETAARLMRMAQAIPDGERRRLFMPGDSVTVKPVASPLILPRGLR